MSDHPTKQTADPDALAVEGLAAQLCHAAPGPLSPWWHLIREEVKEEYRRKAREQIAEHETRTASAFNSRRNFANGA